VEKASRLLSKDALRAVIADRLAKIGALECRARSFSCWKRCSAQCIESAGWRFRAYQMLLFAHWAWRRNKGPRHSVRLRAGDSLFIVELAKGRAPPPVLALGRRHSQNTPDCLAAKPPASRGFRSSSSRSDIRGAEVRPL